MKKLTCRNWRVAVKGGGAILDGDGRLMAETYNGADAKCVATSVNYHDGLMELAKLVSSLNENCLTIGEGRMLEMVRLSRALIKNVEAGA